MVGMVDTTTAATTDLTITEEEGMADTGNLLPGLAFVKNGLAIPNSCGWPFQT